MKNKYLSRGKRTDGQGWVEGSHIDGYITNYIDLATSWTPNTSDHELKIRAFEVDPKTVGLIGEVLGQQFAVGDIVECYNANSETPNAYFGAKEIVEFKNGCLWFRYRDVPIITFLRFGNGEQFACKVVGNIHDNPNLATP